MKRYHPYKKQPNYVEPDSTTNEADPVQQAGSNGGSTGGGAMQEKGPKMPLYDTLRLNQLSFNFKERTWEEITTVPSITPLQLSYNCFFRDDVLKVMEQYFRCMPIGLTGTESAFNQNMNSPYKSFEIVPGEIKLSHFIILSDNIQTGSGGINEVSSFVQRSKVVVFNKPANTHPCCYTFESNGKENNYLTLPVEHLASNQKKATITNLIELGSDTKQAFDSIENLKFFPQGKRRWNNLFNDMANNSIGVLEKQIFPNYIGCSLYNTIFDTNTGASAKASSYVATKAGCFGKFDKSSSNLGSYEKYYSRFHKNYCRENQQFRIIDAGEVVTFQSLPATGQIALTPDPVDNYFSQTPFLTRKDTFQTTEANHYYTGAFKGCDQAYTNEISSQNIVSRIMNNRRNGLGHDLICMIPIRKSDGSLMKLRASCMFEFDWTINLYSRRDTQFMSYNDYVTPGTGSPPAANTVVDADVMAAQPQISPTRLDNDKISLPYFIIRDKEKEMCIFP